jgi:phytoene dehydrogenase-like protein
MFRFTYRMFHEGRTVLPRRGMQAIAEQMRAAIPANKLRLSTPVVWMRDGAVTVGSGEELHAPAIVLATEFDTAGAFTGRFPRRSWRATTTLYFAADKPPYEEPILTLDGNGEGPVNHLAVLTNVQPSYAPPGAALICANIIGPADEHIEAAVRRQLSGWFGDAVHRWRLIGSYVIPHALPEETVGVLNPPVRPARVADGLYRCGDYVASASIHGALLSGRRAAEAVIADLAGAAEHAGQAASSSR